MKYFYEPKSLKAEIDYLLEENYLSKDFNVPKLAKLMGINDRALTRQCKKHLNRTPGKIIQTFKIEKAKPLLKKGLVSKAVADRVGYQCKEAFLYAFKNEVGCGPTSFLSNEDKVIANRRDKAAEKAVNLFYEINSEAEFVAAISNDVHNVDYALLLWSALNHMYKREQK